MEPWDALDTGMFVFTPALFDALEEARVAGETTLSAGVQRLAARGLMIGADVAGAAWCDIDTMDDLTPPPRRSFARSPSVHDEAGAR